MSTMTIVKFKHNNSNPSSVSINSYFDFKRTRYPYIIYFLYVTQSQSQIEKKYI